MFPRAESRRAVETEVMSETATDSDLDQWSSDVYFTGLPSDTQTSEDPPRRLLYRLLVSILDYILKFYRLSSLAKQN